jgi:hypothetical protein
MIWHGFRIFRSTAEAGHAPDRERTERGLKSIKELQIEGFRD